MCTQPGNTIGAGEGNRTLMASLEGWSFTTKLHPHLVVVLSNTSF